MAETHTTPVHGTRSEWIQDRALQAVLGAARALPYARRVAAFGALTRHVAGRATPFRRRILENLDYVWPDVPLSRREAIAGQSLDTFGRALIEHFFMAELAQRLRGTAPSGDGHPLLTDLARQGKPAIVLTGHYGNHEVVWSGLQSDTLRLGGVYRPMSNPYINARYERAARFTGSGPLFAQGRAGMGQMLRHLKGGGAVFMLNDLYVGNGVSLPFLGKPAMTSLSAAELSLRLDAPIFPAYAIRQPDGVSFAIEVEPPIAPSDPETMTAAFNTSLEARIDADPGQWFWVHRRWKRKWNGGKGMEGDPHPAALPRRTAT